jgi:hypothetical protein
VIRTHLFWGYKLSRAEELMPRMQGTSEGEERARADRALTKTYSFTGKA